MNTTNEKSASPFSQGTVPPRRAIVLTVDRLGAGYLGPYGNTWIETPGVNQLASRSLLLENFFVDANDSHQFLLSAMTGRHKLESSLQPETALTGNLADLVRQAGGDSVLLTDDSQLAENEIGDAFDEVLCLEDDGDEPTTAASLEETRLAKTIAAAIDLIERNSETSLIWIHVSSLNSAWDAPLEMRNQFADEEDPDPPKIVTPPAMKLEPDHDPDEVTAIGFAYAGQVVALDWCLAVLAESVEQIDGESRPLFVFAGTRGFSLGEHGTIGEANEGLHEEVVHVPLLIGLPDRSQALVRSQAITQPADLFPLLSGWLTAIDDTAKPLIGIASPDRCAVVQGPWQIAVRTADWYLLINRTTDHAITDAEPSLYLKPDDRWEVNEVASLRQQVAEDLRAFLQEAVQRVENGEPLPRRIRSVANPD